MSSKRVHFDQTPAVSNDLINVRLPEASESFCEESQTEKIISNEEKMLLRKCEDLFGGNCVVKSVMRNKLEAKENYVYLVDKDTEGKISPAIKDGFNYKIQTSRKKSGIPHVLQNQGNAYLHRCRGKLICINQECPVLNRLTVMNQVPMKGKVAEKCRFCYHELQFQNSSISKLQWGKICVEKQHLEVCHCKVYTKPFLW